MVLTWLDMDTDLTAIFNGLRRFPDEEEQPELGDTDSLSERAGPASSRELGTIEPPSLGAPFPSLSWRDYLSDPSW